MPWMCPIRLQGDCFLVVASISHQMARCESVLCGHCLANLWKQFFGGTFPYGLEISTWDFFDQGSIGNEQYLDFSIFYLEKKCKFCVCKERSQLSSWQPLWLLASCLANSNSNGHLEERTCGKDGGPPCWPFSAQLYFFFSESLRIDSLVDFNEK